MRQHAAAAAIFIVLAIVMTWPLAPRMRTAISDPTDPCINTWILDWDHYATFHRGVTLFDANTFYPEHDTLAYSENLYGIAILLMPFRAAGMAPVTAYNLAMLGGFAFAGFAAYLLGFRLTGSFAAGIAAGVFHAFVPFRFTHLPHLQHVFAGWIPLLVVTLLEYVDRPSWKTASLFAAVFLMNALTNIHWMLFGSFAIGATALLLVWSGVRRWRETIATTAVAGVLIAAFLVPYWRVTKMARSVAETKTYSATWSDWMVASDYSRIYEGLKNDSVDPERRLFPGALALAFGAAALFLVQRNPRGVAFGLLWTTIGVFGSFGLNGIFGSFLFDAVPGFRAIRAPARWAEIAYIGLAMLIAVWSAAACRRFRVAGVLIPLAFLIELHAMPLRWHRAPIETPPVYDWIAKTADVHVIAELPMDIRGSEYEYVFRATTHHKKMVNGVSGAMPPEFAKLAYLSTSDQIPDDLGAELQHVGVDTVVIHAGALGSHEKATRDWLRREVQRGRLHFVARFAGGMYGDWVYRFGRGARREINPAAYQPWLFGHLDPPPAHMRGIGWFSGFAFSPYGIRSAEVLFDGGRVRVPAALHRDPRLSAQFPGYPNVAMPRFIAALPKRPDDLPPDTDVQAIVTDGRGQQLRLEFYFLTWE